MTDVPGPSRSEQAVAALKRAGRAQAKAQAEEAEEAALTAQRGSQRATDPVAEESESETDRRGLEWRASACRLCGTTVQPGGESFMVERQRRVPGKGIETYLSPWWKLCLRCSEVGTSVIVHADWLGIEQPFEMGALFDLAREFPQVERTTMGPDGTLFNTSGPLPPGPQRYDLEDGARAGDVGYPAPWQHPSAKRGRPAAKIRWAELQMLWSEDGRRHDTLACCGVCGRSHALRPVLNPPAGWRDNPGNPRWTEVRIMGGLLVCSTCATAYRRSSSGGGFEQWTLADWAAGQASGCYATPGLSAQVGNVLARNAPGVPIGEERQPWQHLGQAALIGLKVWANKASKGKPAAAPVLDRVRSA